ncbi:hypothetical protein GGR21_000578 [Dysgonomonas hofstadii]|uniref:Uncharacterized protein n=1 Tax=Dysgonomonas hofstadii TaxID=637886 RepID=A0A840CHJ9_9BACT|nr:hypothetical protein [Dysgonomonas hofstadii]MBB4034691.1 hypothetical protein [Dysgonomonas hofstadii]
MNTKKYILLLSLMMMLPLFAAGQRMRFVTKREAEQLGQKEYKASTGEVTKVVNTVGSGLDDEYSQFLFRKTGNAEVDSIFSDINSNYDNLEEAALDIDRLLREVDLDRKTNSETNEALQFWIARRNRERKKKEQEAGKVADNLLKRDPSVEQLIRDRYRFGNQPTFYINGVEVDNSVANKLYPGEIIKRDIRTKDTASGNPNGEIWLTVTDKALKRVKIPLELTYNYLYEEAETAPAKELATYLEEKEKERKRIEAKSLPVVRREKTSSGEYVDIPASGQSGTTVIKSQVEETEQARDSRTQVISRSVNDQVVFGREDQPQTSQPASNRQSQPVIKREVESNPANTLPQNNQSQQQAKQKQEVKNEQSSKKSVRKIKQDRERRYDEDGLEIYED